MAALRLSVSVVLCLTVPLLGCGARSQPTGTPIATAVTPARPGEAELPASVKAVQSRFHQHMSLSDLEPTLGRFERRVTSADGPMYSVYRLEDGVAIVAVQGNLNGHLDDVYWVSAGEAPLDKGDNGLGQAARHLVHSW